MIFFVIAVLAKWTINMLFARVIQCLVVQRQQYIEEGLLTIVEVSLIEKSRGR